MLVLHSEMSSGSFHQPKGNFNLCIVKIQYNSLIKYLVVNDIFFSVFVGDVSSVTDVYNPVSPGLLCSDS